MITVTKKFEFESAHFLPNYEGKCKNLHGHTFKMEVTVQKICDGRKVYGGMIIDFSDLKQIVNDTVLEKLDHAYLNDFMQVPTSENLVEWIAGELKKVFGEGLVQVRLYETSNSFATWTAD